MQPVGDGWELNWQEEDEEPQQEIGFQQMLPLMSLLRYNLSHSQQAPVGFMRPVGVELEEDGREIRQQLMPRLNLRLSPLLPWMMSSPREGA